MRFNFKGSTYEILFNRDHKQVEVIDRKRNEKRDQMSKYPSTNVFILKVDENKRAQFWDVVAGTEVGCYHRDKFDLEEGRQWALKKITPQIYAIDPEMVAAMWQAYSMRPKGGNLKEQNRLLRKEVKSLTEQLNDYRNRYEKLLQETTNERI